MSKIPKFILSDQVCHKQLPERTMFIKRFEAEIRDGQVVYTGDVLCFWFENDKPVKKVFHEEDLILTGN